MKKEILKSIVFVWSGEANNQDFIKYITTSVQGTLDQNYTKKLLQRYSNLYII